MIKTVKLKKNTYCDNLRIFRPKIVTPLFKKKKCTNAYKSKYFLIVNISTQGHDTFVLSKHPDRKCCSGCKIGAKSQTMTILGGSTVPVLTAVGLKNRLGYNGTYLPYLPASTHFVILPKKKSMRKQGLSITVVVRVL